MKFWEKSNHKVIFLTKNSHFVDTKEPINIILSPEYYWVKKVQIPVSSTSKAKQYAPAMFEHHLPDNGTYEYSLLSTDETNQFIIVAYDKAQILQQLKSQINDTKNIDMIYWAQMVFPKIETCVNLDNRHSLVNIDDILLFSNHRCEKSAWDVQGLMTNANFTHKGIKLEQLSSTSIPKKSLFTTIAAASAVLIALGIEYGVQSYKINQLEEKIQEIKTQYNLPQTSMQLKSMTDRLQKTDTKQNEIRTLLAIAQDIPLPNGATLGSISYAKESLTVKITLTHKKQQRQLQNYFTRHANIQREDLIGLTYEVQLHHD